MTATLTAGEYVRAIARGDLAEDPRRFRRVICAQDPAEVLSTLDRHRLMELLVTHWQWTDQQISDHTCWDYRTVVRIRQGAFLPPNTERNS